MIADRHQLADFWKWMVHIVHNFCQSFAESSFPIYTSSENQNYWIIPNIFSQVFLNFCFCRFPPLHQLKQSLWCKKMWENWLFHAHTFAYNETINDHVSPFSIYNVPQKGNCKYCRMSRCLPPLHKLGLVGSGSINILNGTTSSAYHTAPHLTKP